MKYVSICSAALALVLAACSSIPNAPDNNQTTLGTGDPGSGSTPPPPSGPIPGSFFAGEIFTGDNYTCGRNSLGKLFCWGNSEYGQLGSGIFPQSLTPKAVALPSGFNLKQISARFRHNCALSTDGDAYCWGWGDGGRLGTGNGISTGFPTKVFMPPGVNFTQISVGDGHTCALDTFGKAYCWGINFFGELGNGTSLNYTFVPKAVTMPPGVSFSHISLGYLRTCALGSNNQTYCWGSNHNNSLGVVSAAEEIKIPVPVKSIGVVFKQLTLSDYTCAVGLDNNAYCWGFNTSGELGNGTTDTYTFPKAVAFPTGVSINSISAGFSHTCALDIQGKAFCWGNGIGGQLGDGQNLATVTFPVPVSMPTGVNFTKISAGTFHTCAVGSDSKTYCWGSNSYGQLGTGDKFGSKVPVQTKPY